MKKIYLFTALALGTLFSANSQVVFNSSIESWAAGAPTDMFGAKTNFTTTAATQVTGSSTYGNNSVRLDNTTTSHKRFTTQQLTVTDVTTYEIKFWAKGMGDVRAGLFDGGPALSGYTYCSYISVNTTTWTEYTQTLVSQNDTTGAEFIFSVKSSVGPDHIMIDSAIISVSTASPSATSIYDIQYNPTPPNDSPYDGMPVNTGGIVSATYTGGYFLQSGAGIWRGVQVNDAVNMPTIGDSVTLTATVDEFFNNTELTGVSAYTVVSSGNTIPGPAIITTTQGNTEDYEGVFARSTSVCVDASMPFGMWAQYTSPDTLKIDDLMYNFSATNGLNYQVTGVISYSYSEFKLNPRNAADVVLITGVEEENELDLISLFPNPASTSFNITNMPYDASVNVYSITGELLLSSKSNLVQTSSLANGTYLVKLVSENEFKTFKLVVKQ